MAFPIDIFKLSTPRKWGFSLYFSSIHDYWYPNTWKSLNHNTWTEMERCEKHDFSSSKCVTWTSM